MPNPDIFGVVYEKHFGNSRVRLVNLIGLNVVTCGVLAAPGFCNDAEKTSADRELRISHFEVSGNQLVSKDTILEVLRTQPGDKYDRNKLYDDLKRINEIGFFKEKSLQLLPSKLPENKVLITICVEENAPVTQFSIQGNEVLKTADISKIFSDQLGKPQNLTQLSSSIDKVEQLYHDKGFVLARFTDVKDFPDGSVSLKINEGQIDKVEISGDRRNKDRLIRNMLKIKPGSIYNEQELANALKKLYARQHFRDIRRSIAPSETNPDMFTLKIEIDEKGTSPQPSTPKPEGLLRPPTIYSLESQHSKVEPPHIYSWESQYPILGVGRRGSKTPSPARLRRWSVPQKPLLLSPAIIPKLEVQTQP